MIPKLTLAALLSFALLILAGPYETMGQNGFWVANQPVPGASFWGFVSCRPNTSLLSPCPSDQEDFLWVI